MLLVQAFFVLLSSLEALFCAELVSLFCAASSLEALFALLVVSVGH